MPNAWTPAELALLAQLHARQVLYTDMPVHFPGRTTRAVLARANRLETRRKNWTAAEDAVLRHMYADACMSELVAALPNRNATAVLRRSGVLGLAKSQRFFQRHMPHDPRRYPPELREVMKLVSQLNAAIESHA